MVFFLKFWIERQYPGISLGAANARRSFQRAVVTTGLHACDAWLQLEMASTEPKQLEPWLESVFPVRFSIFGTETSTYRTEA